MTQTQIAPAKDPNAGVKRAFTATGLTVLSAVTAVLVIVAVTH